LKQAQALGDFQSLASRHRERFVCISAPDVAAGLATLLQIVQKAFPIVQDTRVKRFFAPWRLCALARNCRVIKPYEGCVELFHLTYDHIR